MISSSEEKVQNVGRTENGMKMEVFQEREREIWLDVFVLSFKSFTHKKALQQDNENQTNVIIRRHASYVT